MKKLILLIAAASFVLVGFASTASARWRYCKANYTVNSRNYTGWKNLGKVGGFPRNKKVLCRRKAVAYASRYIKAVLPKTASYCGRRIRWYADTNVQGKRNSKDVSGYLNYNSYYACYMHCHCRPGYRLVGRMCKRAYKSMCLAGPCVYRGLPNGRYGLYTARGGRLYRTCVKYHVVKAFCHWKIR